MSITREKKEHIINDLSESIADSKSLIFLNFHGETVEKTRDLRKELRKMDAIYKVARKTLIKKALDKSDFKGSFSDFKGEMALVFARREDASGVLKFISKKTDKKKFQILGGVFDNEFRDKDFMAALSELPPKEILHYQLLNVLISPLRRVVGSLNGGITNFIRILDQVARSKK